MRWQHSKSDCDDAFRTITGGRTIAKQKGILNCLQGNEALREDMFVDITLYRVPSDLVREFVVKFAYKYPGGISEAIQDLMRNAVKE